MLLEVGLVGLEHAVEPREELGGAVVRVEDDGADSSVATPMAVVHAFEVNLHAIVGGDGSDVVGGSGGTGDGGLLLVGVLQALAAEEGSTALRDLEDDGRVDVSRGLEAGVDDRRRGDVLSEV